MCVIVPLVPFSWLWGKLVLFTLGDYIQQITLAACQPFFCLFSVLLCYILLCKAGTSILGNTAKRNKEDEEKRSKWLLESKLGIHFFWVLMMNCTYGLFPNDNKSINPFSSSNLCHKLILANLSQPASWWKLRPESLSSCQTRLMLVITYSQCLILWLQMATVAKPEIMHVWCALREDSMAGWQQIELRGNVPFKVTWPHPAESRLIPQAAVWLLGQSCSQGKMVECIRTCKWV